MDTRPGYENYLSEVNSLSLQDVSPPGGPARFLVQGKFNATPFTCRLNFATRGVAIFEPRPFGMTFFHR